jgi:hypothetical protein
MGLLSTGVPISQGWIDISFMRNVSPSIMKLKYIVLDRTTTMPCLFYLVGLWSLSQKMSVV